MKKGFLRGVKAYLLPGRPGRTIRQQIVQVVVLLGLVYGASFGGYLFGFYMGTGTLPIGGESYSIVPGSIDPEMTSEQLFRFVEADGTNLNKYDVGFNCVEFALLMARNARWAGVPVEVIRIEFEEGVQHMVLAFPTTDEGWIFIDPASELRIKPRVGGMLGGGRVTQLYLLREEWVPFKEVAE